MDKQYQYSDGSSITLAEIEQMNVDDPLLTDEDIEAISDLQIGESYMIEMDSYLIRTR